jgi:FKBP-type peptidyl-prolyl cis-trans isomerase
MTNIKNIIVVALLAVIIYACSSESGVVDNFDHAAQAAKDKDTIVKYLTNHYYDATIDSIKPIVTGKTALIDDANLRVKDVTEQDVNYKFYYYVVREGSPDPVKGNPTMMDSILVKYQGRQLTTALQPNVFETRIYATWLTLNSVIRGWANGFIHFKGGKNITNNGPITYENGGKGYMFIPSGLGYRNFDNGSITANTCLVFRFDLFDIVEGTDHDNDGLASSLEIEDASVESDPRKVDTDGDSIANYLDADDDGDGKLTKDEDANGDGDPRNDFSDPNNPNLPDYLNPKIK